MSGRVFSGTPIFKQIPVIDRYIGAYIEIVG
jgi:hypothetical protein